MKVETCRTLVLSDTVSVLHLSHSVLHLSQSLCYTSYTLCYTSLSYLPYACTLWHRPSLCVTPGNVCQSVLSPPPTCPHLLPTSYLQLQMFVSPLHVNCSNWQSEDRALLSVHSESFARIDGWLNKWKGPVTTEGSWYGRISKFASFARKDEKLNRR